MTSTFRLEFQCMLLCWMKALQDRRVWEWQRFMHQQLWEYNGLSTAVCKDPNSQVSVWIKLCCKQKGAQVNGSWMLINWCHFSAVCHGDLAGLGTWSGVAGKELGQLFTFSNIPFCTCTTAKISSTLASSAASEFFGPIFWVNWCLLILKSKDITIWINSQASHFAARFKQTLYWIKTAGQKGWHWATLSAGAALTFKTSEERGLQSIMSKLMTVFGSI